MELKFDYGSRIITFNLIYRKRKTMSIEVETTGEVTVIAPVGTSTDDVIEKVKSRVGWIVSKQYESKFINYTKIKREAVSGESYMYLGRNYSLDIRVDENVDKILVKLFQGKFVVNTYTKDEDLINKLVSLNLTRFQDVKLYFNIDRVYNPETRFSSWEVQLVGVG